MMVVVDGILSSSSKSIDGDEGRGVDEEKKERGNERIGMRRR